MTESIVAPGLSKQINKRIKAYGVASAFFLLLAATQVFLKDLLQWQVILMSGGFGIFVVLATAFSIRFRGGVVGFFKLFFLPFVLVSLLIFSLRQIFFTDFARFADIFFFGLIAFLFSTVIYGIVLTVNILYIASLKSIPLVQVAHSVWYILTVAVVFIFTYWSLLSFDAVYFVLPVIFLMYVLLIAQHLSHFELSDKDIRLKTTGIVLGMLSVLSFVIFWPTEVYMKAFVAALASYIGLGLVMHDLKKALGIRVYFEYFILIVIFIAMLFITSSWGIFGKIF